MTDNKLLKDYLYGTGFKYGDVLEPREGSTDPTFGVTGSRVTVIKQSALAPHKYTVIGERPEPKSPADRFVKFEINGHNWRMATP